MQFTDEQQHYIDEHYQLLPLDADGVPIHVWDKMEGKGEIGIVTSVSSNGIVLDYLTYHFNPAAFKHYRKPTVEEVLKEMLGSYDVKRGYTCGHQTPQNEIIAEYAKLLRLKDDE